MVLYMILFLCNILQWSLTTLHHQLCLNFLLLSGGFGPKAQREAFSEGGFTAILIFVVFLESWFQIQLRFGGIARALRFDLFAL